MRENADICKGQISKYVAIEVTISGRFKLGVYSDYLPDTISWHKGLSCKCVNELWHLTLNISSD